MATFLSRATLLGSPDIPGNLYAEPIGLTFTPNKFQHTAMTIPWENLIEWGWNYYTDGGLRHAVSLIVLPISLITNGAIDPATHIYMTIKFDDPENYVTHSIPFKVGGAGDKRHADTLIDTITRLRGEYLKSKQQSSFIQYR